MHDDTHPEIPPPPARDTAPLPPAWAADLARQWREAEEALDRETEEGES